MKKIILAAMISLIALPAAAASDAKWTGEKRMKDGDKLECKYRFFQGRTKYLPAYWADVWNTSWEHGQSPICAPTQYDSGSQWWHMTEESARYWKEWKTTNGYTKFKTVQEEEKKVKNSDYQQFILVTSDDKLVKVNKGPLLSYLARVRVGLGEPYDTFIANNTASNVDMGSMTPEMQKLALKAYEPLSYAANVRY